MSLGPHCFMSTQTARCRLCHSKAKLKDSHVVPEFFYHLCYDEKHRFHLTPSPKTSNAPRIEQQGLRERLLCGKCETMLSVFEGHAKNVLFETETFRRTFLPSRTVVHGVNYARFKLFLLSMLWRASVSSLETFQCVKLGPHEETLRRMVLEALPGGPFDYPTELVICSKVAEELRHNIAPPLRFRIHTYITYMFMFGDLFCNFFISKDVRSPGIYLSEDGDLPIHEDPFGLYSAYLADYVSYVRELKGEKPLGPRPNLFGFRSL